MIETIDGLSMNIERANMDKLKAVFPECFAEGKLDIDKLLSLCGEYIDNDFEKYKFEWNGKSECLKLAQKRSAGTLRPCPEESVNFDTTQNLYIEGDNLEVLKLLQTAYYRKVKMIYIDPPYNTGNDFVYADDFADPIARYKEVTQQTTKSNPETMGRFHTNWLNMMYPRLRLAANLLRDDGVIFISIDDNEVTNLKRLCDETFGEENFIAQITVIVKTEGRQYGSFAKTHEFILVYAKSVNAIQLNEIKVINGEFKYRDEKGGFNIIGLRNRAVRIFNSTNRPNLRYPFYVDVNNKDEYGFSKVSTIALEGWKEVWASVVDGLESVWRWGKETAEKNKDELVAMEGNDNEIRIFKKDRDLTTLPKTVWFQKEFNSIVGTREVAAIVGKGLFDFPKPLSLLKQLVEIATNDDDIILDFFSGSATTAHAVMQLNVEDGGNRRFICVQLPELCDEKSEAYKAGYKNICEIGKERIRRAGKSILDRQCTAIFLEAGLDLLQTQLDMENTADVDHEMDVYDKLDVGFKVFKLDTSNLKTWDNTLVAYDDMQLLLERMNGMIHRVKSDRSDMDMVCEIMLKLGVPLDCSVEKIEFNGKTAYTVGKDCLLLVCLAEDVQPEDVETMAEYAPAKVIIARDSFADDTAMSNAHYILRDRGIELKLV